MDNTTIIEGHGPTDGRNQDTTSYRTELSGTIAILAIYNMTVNVYNWKAKEIEHVYGTRNQMLLHKAKHTKSRQPGSEDTRTNVDHLTLTRKTYI
jgi:hypothetical protein